MVGTMRLLLLTGIPLLAVGCRQDMHDQPRYEAYESSEFLPDGTSALTPVPGTVARGQLHEDALLHTGRQGTGFAEVFPFAMTMADLERGQQRYDIYCSVCHDRAGTGNGMIVRRGFPPPESFHQDRLRAAPPGYFFNVITNGFGKMYSYRARVKVEDRWRIAAYIRALQLSQNVPASELTDEDRRELARATGEGT